MRPCQRCVNHGLECRKALSIDVFKPDALLAWLEINNASYITALDVHLDVYNKAPSAARWSRLFEKLRREATNLQHLPIY